MPVARRVGGTHAHPQGQQYRRVTAASVEARRLTISWPSGVNMRLLAASVEGTIGILLTRVAAMRGG